MKEYNSRKAIVKYLANEATASEEALLYNWVESKQNKKIFKEFLKAQLLLEISYSSVDSELAFENFLKQIRENKNKNITKLKAFVPYFKYAAIIVIGFLTIFYLLNKKNSVTSFVDFKNGISLQIINGDSEYFYNDTDKVVQTKNGVELAALNNGILKYSPNLSKVKGVIFENILTVPYGKKFKVILSDGSEVQINSGTTFKYPNVFNENMSREIYLEGEAYFNVSRTSGTPFLVNTKASVTKVFGTEFNVSSYSNDYKTEIVLVEGSVGVKSIYSEKNQKVYKRIMPSQKVTISKETKDLEITNVNIQKYIAWKEGVLIFENDNFESIVKILERHYNVKILNNFKNINNFKYNGIFENDSIEKILNTIKIHTNFSFERESDTIIIINPKII
jgi:hypothetical protein